MCMYTYMVLYSVHIYIYMCTLICSLDKYPGSFNFETKAVSHSSATVQPCRAKRGPQHSSKKVDRDGVAGQSADLSGAQVMP